MNPGLNPAFRRPAQRTRTPLPGFSFGNALLFDGVNDFAYVSVGSATGHFPPIGRNGTVSFWVRHTSTSNQGFFSWGASGNQLGFSTNVNGTIAFLSGISVFDPRTTVNSWVHALIVWHDEAPRVRLCLYLNGVKVLEQLVETGWPTGATEFRVGNIVGSSSRLAGRLDEFLVYDRPLAWHEVQALWGTGLGARFVPTTGLLARWAFDETGGTTASDSSGHGRHLTLLNGPTFVPHY